MPDTHSQVGGDGVPVLDGEDHVQVHQDRPSGPVVHHPVVARCKSHRREVNQPVPADWA